MADTDKGGGDFDRQLEFLLEAFGLSEAEAREVLEEYEGLHDSSEPTGEEVEMEIEEIDSGQLGRLLDALWNQRARAEDQLEEDEVIGDVELAENLVDREQIRLEPIDKEGRFDIYEIDGKRLVPYEQVREVLVEFHQRMEQSINELNELSDRAERIDRDSGLSEEAKQAIDNIYERANKHGD